MYIAQGQSISKIADEIGVRKATVQSYINRAKKKVKE
ncbi:sigma factor-like helix-turn-helix DNA-binding protein [Psychrobacillus sp. FJAT-21963]|nr:sigma factor-like helix-turn-helix DNA-binding protein [Psychrobacillus sp. FJAT-21963]